MTDEQFERWRIDTAKKRMEQIRYMIRTSLVEKEYMEWLEAYWKLRTFLKERGVICA